MKPLMSALFLSCKKSTEMIEKREVFGLTTLENARLRFHLSICDVCKNYNVYSKKIDGILQSILTKKPTTDDNPLFNQRLKEKILEKINKINACQV